jgi:hypothetical protein
MSPLVIGAITRSACRSSPASTSARAGPHPARRLRAYQAQLCREVGHDVDEPTAAGCG